MKKYLIYADPHFCQYSSIIRQRGEKYSLRLHNLIDSINWAENTAEELGCDEIIVAGDFFDRTNLNAEEITALQDIKWANMPHSFIVGNHEASVSNLMYSTTSIFKSIDARIISEPEYSTVVPGVELYYIPYYTSDNIESITEYLSDNNCKKVVVSHNDLAGIQYGRFTSQSGFDVGEVLDNCTLFINGHLHNGYIINDRIILVGNLTGQNFNEDATKYSHNAYVMTINDDASINLEPIENPAALNFYKLDFRFATDLSILDSLKNNCVLSITCSDKLKPEVENKLESLTNVIAHRIVVVNSYDLSEEEDIQLTPDKDHIELFIEFVPTKIQPSDMLFEELDLLRTL